jgi:hypothetical protein
VGDPLPKGQVMRVTTRLALYKNAANGLVMTLVGDFNGAPLQIRSMGLGTGGNKNFKFVHTAP